MLLGIFTLSHITQKAPPRKHFCIAAGRIANRHPVDRTKCLLHFNHSVLLFDFSIDFRQLYMENAVLDVG